MEGAEVRMAAESLAPCLSPEKTRVLLYPWGLGTTVVYPRVLNLGVWARWDWEAQQQGSEPEGGQAWSPALLPSLPWPGGGQVLLRDFL